MQDYVMRNWSMVRTGTNATQKKLFFHLRRAIAKHIDDVTRDEPLSVRVARDLQVPEKQVEAMMGRMSGPDLSLDAPQSSDDEGRSWVETIEDESAQTEADVTERLDGDRRRAALYDAVEQLPERERAIVSARHLSEDPTTLSDLGADMGISKERVRQLEERALVRLTAIVRATSLVEPA